MQHVISYTYSIITMSLTSFATINPLSTPSISLSPVSVFASDAITLSPLKLSSLPYVKWMPSYSNLFSKVLSACMLIVASVLSLVR